VSPPLSDFDKKLMLQVRDKIYALREANNDLRDRLDASNERVVVQEAEISRLRMQLEKITAVKNKRKFCRSKMISAVVFAVILCLLTRLFQHGAVVGSSKSYELM
jgi:hypothetical protein